MRFTDLKWITFAVLATSLAQTAAAQTPQFVYSYRPPTQNGLVQVAPNGTVNIGAVSVGKDVTITFIAENQGPTPWTINKATVSGGPYTLTGNIPQLVNPQSAGLVNINFKPTAPDNSLGRLQLELTNTGTTVQVVFFLDGRGVAPDFATSYAFPNGNQTTIAAGGTITFEQVTLNTTLTATFFINNRGTGPGTISGVTVTGNGFTVTGLPLLPAAVAPGDATTSLRFNINFTPRDRGSFPGTLRIDFDGAPSRTFTLAGQGAGPSLTYQYVSGSDLRDVLANGAIPVPDTAVGANQSVTVVIRNGGTVATQVGTILLTGTDLALTQLPPLPANLGVGESLRFGIQFAPKVAGAVEGTLRVDNTTFRVTTNGLGAKFAFQATVGSVTQEIGGGGTLNFPNTVVGASAAATIEIRNDGTRAGNISGISAAPAVFTLAGLPALPLSVNPGQSVQVRVQFAPQALGNVAGTLQIDDVTLNLRGVGGNPPALPAATFSGLTDTANPLDQPTVSLQLNSAYPYDLTGTLTLAFTSGSVVDDPAIQFSSGGRTVAFRVPANTRDVLFGQQGARQVQFQTGTIAGDIQVIANFLVGQVSLTGQGAAAPPTKSVTIAQGPPQIRNVRLGTVSTAAFEILVTGFTSTRSVQTINLTFTGVSGANLQTTTLQANVEGPFSAWYQNAASQPFGSQFTASITVGVNGDISAVQSVSVTAANARGTSSAQTVSLR
ncbi:MAG: choice-of-anchor D domain-containing protein [Bryobacteraceae bacterium]